jgi:hypothetical protein
MLDQQDIIIQVRWTSLSCLILVFMDVYKDEYTAFTLRFHRVKTISLNRWNCQFFSARNIHFDINLCSLREILSVGHVQMSKYICRWITGHGPYLHASKPWFYKHSDRSWISIWSKVLGLLTMRKWSRHFQEERKDLSDHPKWNTLYIETNGEYSPVEITYPRNREHSSRETKDIR